MEIEVRTIDEASYNRLIAENNGLKQMESAVRRERDDLQTRLHASEKTRLWLIERFEDECKRAGFELHWTDGGGSDCPGGWHRNPYLNRGDVLAELIAIRDHASGDEVLLLKSELASERATTAGLRKALERMKADAFDGFRRLTAERDAALSEVRRLSKPPAPNLPDSEGMN